MNRRNFLSSLIGVAAPAIVRVESLMKLWVPPKEILTLDRLRAVKAKILRNAIPGEFLVYVHPDREADLRELLAEPPKRISYRRWIPYGESPVVVPEGITLADYGMGIVINA